jgi:hypothetical protein
LDPVERNCVLLGVARLKKLRGRQLLYQLFNRVQVCVSPKFCPFLQRVRWLIQGDLGWVAEVQQILDLYYQAKDNDL